MNRVVGATERGDRALRPLERRYLDNRVDGNLRNTVNQMRQNNNNLNNIAGQLRDGARNNVESRQADRLTFYRRGHRLVRLK